MGLHFYPFSSCFFESIRPTLLCWLPVFCEDIFDQVYKIPSAIYIHESPLRHFFLQLSKLWTTIQCMLHIFRVFSTNITAAVLDNLSSNQVVFGWQGVLGCSPNQVLYFARYGEVPNSLPQWFQPRNIRLTRLCILVLSLQELIPKFNCILSSRIIGPCEDI